MDAVRSDTGTDPAPQGRRHQLVQGLPASLLAVEGKTFAVVALMQREGWLSRDRRRGVAVDPRPLQSWPAGVDTSLPRAELHLLARFIDPHPRAIAFWNLVAARRERRRSEALSAAHIVSLEAQLLRSYEPAWDTQEFNDEALRQACPPWPEIRARIEEETAHLVRRPRLAPCMVWLALSADLDRWPALDERRRRAVAHAVFALASACWSDWFVRESLRRCPELESELGRTCAGVPAAPPAAPEPPARVPLALVVERLTALCAELAEQPTQDAVRELLACAGDAQAWEQALPDRVLVATRELRQAVEALLVQAREQALTRALAWLGPDVWAQVEARWSLAALGRDAPALRQLAQDAVQARARLHEAVGRCAEAQALLETARASLHALDAELQAAPSLARRREIEGARLLALRTLLDAEGGQAALEDAVLASVSPGAEAFDLRADYRADYRAALLPPASGSAPVRVIDEASAMASSGPALKPPALPQAAAACGDLAVALPG